MSAVAEKKGQDMAETNTVSMFERLACDPNVDVDKLERLMQMNERALMRQAEAVFASALADMQQELPSIAEKGDASGRYTYAKWEHINTAIKPILHRHGFALSFRTNFAEGIEVTAVLSHKSGHSERTAIKLPADGSGNKNAVQAVASSVSYGKRYTAGALLNLTSHGEDDDAYAAGDRSAPITEEQEGELSKLVQSLPADRQEAFMKWAKVRNLSQIVQGAFEDSRKALEREIDRQKEAK